MASENGNGSNRTRLEQISDSPKWTALGRISSILNAAAIFVLTGVVTWAGATLVDVKDTATRTAVQLEDFKDDAERSRADTKDRFDSMAAWISTSLAKMSDRIDRLHE